jgi:hypothetical protein
MAAAAAIAITGRAELAERSTTREPGIGGSPLPRFQEEKKNKLEGELHEVFDLWFLSISKHICDHQVLFAQFWCGLLGIR